MMTRIILAFCSFLVLASCASTETPENRKLWRTIKARKALVHFVPINEYSTYPVIDGNAVVRDNDTLWVTAYHNPRSAPYVDPALHVTFSIKKTPSFELSEDNSSVTTNRLGKVPFLKIDEYISDIYTKLRFRKTLKPKDYYKLIGDTLKIQFNDKLYLFLGVEKKMQ